MVSYGSKRHRVWRMRAAWTSDHPQKVVVVIWAIHFMQRVCFMLIILLREAFQLSESLDQRQGFDLFEGQSLVVADQAADEEEDDQDQAGDHLSCVQIKEKWRLL